MPSKPGSEDPRGTRWLEYFRTQPMRVKDFSSVALQVGARTRAGGEQVALALSLDTCVEPEGCEEIGRNELVALISPHPGPQFGRLGVLLWRQTQRAYNLFERTLGRGQMSDSTGIRKI